MTTEQATEISALFDGELETHEVRSAIHVSLNDNERWRIYSLVGDGLRGEPGDSRDITACVMARIATEPVVLAPGKLVPRQRTHPFLALAASVAGVAVVGWLALTSKPAIEAPAQFAAAAAPPQVALAPPLRATEQRPHFEIASMPVVGHYGSVHELALVAIQPHAESAGGRGK